jgi:hypothetical protein
VPLGVTGRGVALASVVASAVAAARKETVASLSIVERMAFS